MRIESLRAKRRVVFVTVSGLSLGDDKPLVFQFRKRTLFVKECALKHLLKDTRYLPYFMQHTLFKSVTIFNLNGNSHMFLLFFLVRKIILSRK